MLSNQIKPVSFVKSLFAAFLLCAFAISFSSCSEESKAEKCVKEFIKAKNNEDYQAMDKFYPNREPSIKTNFEEGDIVETTKKDSIFVVSLTKNRKLYVTKSQQGEYFIADSKGFLNFKKSTGIYYKIAKKTGLLTNYPNVSKYTDRKACDTLEKFESSITRTLLGEFKDYLLRDDPYAETYGVKILSKKTERLLDMYTYDITIQAGKVPIPYVFVTIFAYDKDGQIIKRGGERVRYLSPREVKQASGYFYNANMIKNIKVTLNVDYSDGIYDYIYKTVKFTGTEYQDYLASKKVETKQ